MTTEVHTPESVIIQEAGKEDIDSTDREEHTSFENVLQTRGTNDDEQRKNNLKVGNGNNECTDGECFLYPPSVVKVAYEDVDGQSEDSPEGILDDAKNIISKNDNQQQSSNKVATEEEAEDAKGKETSDNVISVNQELENGQNNEEEKSDIKKDNKRDSEMDAHNKHLGNFNLLEKKTVEFPVCAVYHQLEGFKIDAKSESNACDPKKCTERTSSRNLTVSTGIFEATVSEAEELEKASKAVVGEPEIMARTENKNTQKQEDEMTASRALADISMLHTSSSPTDSDKESISETMKDIKELGISSWERIDTVEEKKGPHADGKDYNLDEASKPLFERDFEDTTSSSKMFKNKIGTEDKNFESNTENQEEELETGEGDQNKVDSFLSEIDSEVTIKGALETSMEKPEDCTMKATMNQEGRVRENLEETLTMTSENSKTAETTEEITFYKQGEAKSDMENSEVQRNQNDRVGTANGDTARISQDNTIEANLNEATDFRDSITSKNEEDLYLGNNLVAREREDEKKDVCTEFQPKEQEKQDAEVSNEEKFDNEQASEASKNTEFTYSEVNSDEGTESKNVGFTTSMEKEEKISEVVETESEKRHEIQSAEELTETETKRKASDINFQESRNASEAKEEAICKDDFTGVIISPQTSAETIKQSSFEVKEADISDMNDFDPKDFKSKRLPAEKGKDESTLSKEEHIDDTMKNIQDSIQDGGFQNDEIENQIFEERNTGIGEAYQEIVEYPTQNEVTKIDNDSIQVVVAEGTTDRQHENRKDEDLYNIISGVTTDQDITAESNSIEVKEDEKMHEQIGFNEVHETETVTNEEIVNQSSGERDSCSRNHCQEINEAYTPFIEVNGECTRISNDEIHIHEVKEEAATDTQQYNGETRDPNKTAKGVPACMVRRMEIEQENKNSKNALEDVDQDTKTKSSNIEKEKDDKINEECCSNEIHEEVVNNEKIVNQSFKESDSCTGTRDEDIAQAPPPPLEAENLVPSYNECTRVASNEIRVSEIEEETAIEKQSTETENPNKMQNGVASCEIKGVEIVQENVNSMNKVKFVDQDISSKPESIEVQTDEQTGSSEIHKMEEVNNVEIVNLRSKERNSYSGKQDQEISQAFAPLKEVKKPDLSKDDCTSFFSKEVQVTEVEEEVKIDQQQYISETKNPNKTKIGVYSHEVRGFEVSLEEEKFIEDGKQDINAHSGSIEVHKNDKINEQSFSNEIHETEAVNNKDFVNRYKESDPCSRKEDKDIAQAATPHLEADNHVPSNEECTRISSDAIQVSKIEEEAAKEEQQFSTNNEHTNKATNGVSTYEVMRVEIIQENQNSMNIVEAVNQDINADLENIQVLKDESTHDQPIHETEAVNDDEIANQSSEKSDSCSGKEDQDFSQASTPLLEAGNPILSNEECNSISSEEMENREVEGKATFVKQQCSTINENLIKIPSGLSCAEFTRVEIIQENENSMKIVEDARDINVESDNIQVLQDENTHEQTGLNAIHETKVVNNEENMNKISNEKDACGGKQNQEISEAEDIVPSNDVCTMVSSEEIQFSEAEEDTSVYKIQSRLEMEELNKTGKANSHEVSTVETLPETENSMIIREDVNKDINVQLRSIEVQKNEKTYEQTCSDEIQETAAANNEDIVNQSFEDSNSRNGKQDQEIAPASTLLLETEDPISSNNDCTRIPSEDKEEAAIMKQQFRTRDEGPNKTENGVSSKVWGAEIAQDNENFINIVEDVNQVVYLDSDTIGAQRDAKTNKETSIYEIRDRKTDIHEEVVNLSSVDEGIAKASPPLTAVEIPNKDECTNITREEIQVSEVEEEVAVEKKQHSTEIEDEYKITNGVCPCEVNGMDIEPKTEGYMNIEQGKDQDINGELDNIDVLKNDKKHKQTGSHKIHETEVVNNEDILGQSASEKQDQEIVEASALLIEAENLVASKDECIWISSEEIQATAMKEEAADPDKTKPGVSSEEIRGVEIKPGKENSITIEENVDQQDTIDLQKDERTHEQISSNEIHGKQSVNNDEIVNPCSEESNSYNGKQDQEIAKEFTPLTENPTSSKDECTRISSVKIQEVRREATMETMDQNKIKNSISCMAKGVEILPEYESYMNKMEDVLQVEKELKLYENTHSSDKQCTEEDFHHVREGDMAGDKNIEPAALKEIFTCCSESIKHREEKNKGNNTISRNIEDQGANSTEKLIGNGSREINIQEISQYEGTMEKAKDADQQKIQINKEYPFIKRECKQDDSQQSIAQEKTNDEVKSTHVVQPEDERNMFDKKILEGEESPEICKSSEIGGSLSFPENEIMEIRENFKDRIPNQQKPVGTASSGQNGNAEMSNLDQGQSPKMSNDHTQLVEFNKTAGFESEHHKHVNEVHEDMTNSLEEEVKHANKSISRDEMDTVSKKFKQEASIAEVSSAQNFLALQFGIPKESIDKDKQGGNSDKTNYILNTIMIVKEGTSSHEVLPERKIEKAHEVCSTEESLHSSDRKENSRKVEDLNILAADKVEMMKITELDHNSLAMASTKLYAKQSVEDQESDDAKQEAKFSTAAVSSINCQDANETITNETVQKEIWQENELLNQLHEPPFEYLEKQHVVTRTEEKDESSKRMENLKEEKPIECSSDQIHLMSQETFLSEEEQLELEASNSVFIPSAELRLKLAENVPTEESQEPRELSSEFQGSDSSSEIASNRESEIYKGSCFLDTKEENECQFLEKSEQTNDTFVQHNSSSKLISEKNNVQIYQATNVQGKKSFEQVAKQYDQEGISSEDSDKEKHQKAENSELVKEEDQGMENLEEHKIAICDITSTEVTREANVSDESNNSEIETRKEAFQQAPSAERAANRENSMDSVKDSSEASERNDFMQDLYSRKHESLLKLTKSNEINGSNSQEALLQGDMQEAVDIETILESQQTNNRQMFPPKVEKLDILPPEEVKETTDISELEQKTRDVSSREINENQSTEKLELDDAERGITLPDQMAIHTKFQDVKETSTLASDISQENETDEQLQAPSSKHLDQIYGTTKTVAEIEERTDNSSSEKPVSETCMPEIELREFEVPNLNKEPIEDSLEEIVKKIGEETEDLSVEFEVTSSTSESKMSTEPLSYSDSSSQTIHIKSKLHDSKNVLEIPDVSPQFDSGKSFGTSSRVSTEFNEETESFQQVPEPKSEELSESEKTCHQTKSIDLITEENSLTNIETHEATRDKVKHDKIAELSVDPTIAQQNLQETKSLDKEEKMIMEDEQETITEFSNSSVEDGTDDKAIRQGPPEHKDSKEFSQIEKMRELDTPHIEVQQEHQEIHNSLPASSQFQESTSNVLKDESIDDKLQLQAESKEEPEEHNEKACAGKGVTVIESERNGVPSLPPYGDVKESLESAATYDSSNATNRNTKRTDTKSNKTRICSVGSERNRVFSLATNDPDKHIIERTATDDSSNATDGNSARTVKNPNKTRTHSIESERFGVSLIALNDPVKNIIEGAATDDSSNATDANSERTEKNPNKTQTHTITSDTTNKQQEIIIEEITAEKSKSDEEKDESESQGLLISEELREMDLKTTQKKPHNILSGVGSKVKHSISKVKKAMTCSSSQFEPRDVIIKRNKTKRSSN